MNVKAIVDTFNQEKALVEAFSALQAMATVFRFPFPKHLVEECVDLS